MKEVTNHRQLATWLAKMEKAPSDRRHPIAVQELNLGVLEEEVLEAWVEGSLFLGCTMKQSTAAYIVEQGGVVIPNLTGFLFKAHRASLYSVGELFKGFDSGTEAGHKATFDYAVYEEYCRHGKSPISIKTSLARRLHDHSITDALEEELEGRDVVAVMGGHGMERGDAFYARIARVARRLTRAGFLLVSGGGPGAMEATHLGAYFAARSSDELAAALEILKVRPKGAKPGKEYADPDWLARAWRILEEFPIPRGGEKSCKSIGIPTWLYGHEPPTPFATQIAKYFANSVREDGLLAVAKQGVIFAPGSAGTTQEIFQDAAQNHYATQQVISPMILFGEDYWTTERPVWPLLQHVAKGHQYAELLTLTDSEDEIFDSISSFDASSP